MANQPMLPKSHTNSADLTSRLPDGRSTRDRTKLAKHLQAINRMAQARNATRVPVLYPRPIGRLYDRLVKKICLPGPLPELSAPKTF